MRFYTKTHTQYCGIDLHARTIYLCILDREGEAALYMKAIHGGKAKNDKVDALKIASLLQGGMLPRPTHPPEMGATRDLLQRFLAGAK